MIQGWVSYRGIDEKRYSTRFCIWAANEPKAEDGMAPYGYCSKFNEMQ